jgi:hypothetical protein
VEMEPVASRACPRAEVSSRRAKRRVNSNIAHPFIRIPHAPCRQGRGVLIAEVVRSWQMRKPFDWF